MFYYPMVLCFTTVSLQEIKLERVALNQLENFNGLVLFEFSFIPSMLYIFFLLFLSRSRFRISFLRACYLVLLCSFNEINGILISFTNAHTNHFSTMNNKQTFLFYFYTHTLYFDCPAIKQQ